MHCVLGMDTSVPRCSTSLAGRVVQDRVCILTASGTTMMVAPSTRADPGGTVKVKQSRPACHDRSKLLSLYAFGRLGLHKHATEEPCVRPLRCTGAGCQLRRRNMVKRRLHRQPRRRLQVHPNGCSRTTAFLTNMLQTSIILPTTASKSPETLGELTVSDLDIGEACWITIWYVYVRQVQRVYRCSRDFCSGRKTTVAACPDLTLLRRKAVFRFPSAPLP